MGAIGLTTLAALGWLWGTVGTRNEASQAMPWTPAAYEESGVRFAGMGAASGPAQAGHPLRPIYPVHPVPYGGPGRVLLPPGSAGPPGSGEGMVRKLVPGSERMLIPMPQPSEPDGHTWVSDEAPRVAQAPQAPPVIRPEAPKAESPAPARSAESQGRAAPPEPPQAAGPLDPSGFRLQTLGLPAALDVPRPDAATRQLYSRFVQSQIDASNTIVLSVNRAKVLLFRQAPLRIYTPDEDVIVTQVITPEQLLVQGQEPGTTVLNLWFADPAEPNKEHLLTYLVRVLPDVVPGQELKARLDLAYRELERRINEAFPDSMIRLSLLGEQVLVRGQAKDVIEAAHILRIVAEHAPPGRRSRVRSDEIPPIILRGDGSDIEQGIDAIRAVLRGNPNLVNLLHIPGEQQVMLMVTVAEVNRSAARSIGLNFDIQEGGFRIAQFTGGLLSATAAGFSGQAVNVPVSIDNGDVLLAIQALRNLRLARTLAEPNLTTLNGRTARFQAGGQFPVPVVTGTTFTGLQGVAYVPFGVQLEFTPYIADRDRIRLNVEAEVSTRNEDTGTQVGNSNVSGLDTRNFQTTVELRHGQTLAVAGLIQHNLESQSDRTPLWGDLPLVGHTGGRSSVSAGEQELVILVTPLLVHPLERCQTPGLPGDDVFEPGDVEFYLLGRMEGRRSEDFRSPVRTDCDRIKQWRRCEEMFIIGRQGPTYGCCPEATASPSPCPSPCPSPRPQPVGAAYAEAPLDTRGLP